MPSFAPPSSQSEPIGLLYRLLASDVPSEDADLSALLALAIPALGVEAGYVGTIEGDQYTVEAAYPPTGPLAPGEVVPLIQRPCARAVKEGRVVLAEADNEYPGLVAYLAAPVQIGGQIGTVCFTSSRTTVFGEGAIALIEHLATWIGTDATTEAGTSTTVQQAVDRFGHEVRTPLTTVLGLSHLLRETPLNANQRVLLDGIETAARALQSVLEVALHETSDATPVTVKTVVEPPAEASLADVSGTRILLVEDEPANRYLARALLESWGVVVTEAGDGGEAIQIVADSHDFDLVLMDLQMPRMDGLEATRIIRETLRISSEALPIIAVTATSLASQHDAIAASGLDEVLRKPYRSDTLRDLISRWVQVDASTDPVSSPPPLAPTVRSPQAVPDTAG
ncbi:MAG: response regulator [Bacteroidota bacterium]